MSKIKSLADQLRDRMAAPEPVPPVPKPKVLVTPGPKPLKKPPQLVSSDLVNLILNYDSSANRAMVHVKLDDATAKLVSHFKIATGIDNIRLVAFSVKHLFDTNPELKDIIKQYTQNLEL